MAKDKDFDQRVYRLGLHGVIYLGDIQATVVRVPGGWTYEFNGREPVFIPFDNEFQRVST